MDLMKIHQNKRFDTVLLSVAVLILLMSSLHFWPFSSSKLWQYAVPFNSLPLLFGGVLFCLSVLRSDWVKIRVPASVVFFVIICALSLIISPDFKRSLFYTVKIFGALIGFYFLLLSILKKTGNLRLITITIVASCFISVICCLIFRIALSDKVFGFHNNAYKYSTYISIFGGFSISYLIVQKGIISQFLGYILLILLILSAGTIGLIISMAVAVSLMALFSLWLFQGNFRRVVFLKYTICVILCFGCLAVKSETFLPIHDGQLDDGQLAPLKQRYIEWQAEINILKDRIVAGCGAGAINTYRSKYYGQLPKFNTLEAFDQNGYLATAAELGLLGLVALIWILSDYFRKIFTGLSSSDDGNNFLILSCLCSLIAASVANLFSSFFYNGVLVSLVSVFVLVDYIVELNKGESK